MIGCMIFVSTDFNEKGDRYTFGNRRNIRLSFVLLMFMTHVWCRSTAQHTDEKFVTPRATFSNSVLLAHCSKLSRIQLIFKSLSSLTNT